MYLFTGLLPVLLYFVVSVAWSYPKIRDYLERRAFIRETKRYIRSIQTTDAKEKQNER